MSLLFNMCTLGCYPDSLERVSMKKHLLSFLVLTFSWSASAVDVEQKTVEFINLARQAEPFRMYGVDQLNLKIAMASVAEKGTVDVEHIKQLHASIQNKIIKTKREFESFQEFLDAEKAAWPSSGDLMTDIKRIQSNGISLFEPLFKNEVDIKIWNDNKANQAKFASQAGLAGMGVFLELSQYTPEQKAEFQTQITKLIGDFNNFENRLQNSFKNIFVNEGDGFLKVAFPILMSEYIENVNHKTKLNILAGMFEGSLPFTQESLVMSLFMNAGPQLQKMVQTLGRNKALSPKWKELFQTFESNVRPVPFWQVQELLASAKFPFKILDFSSEPLGVGTIAQVHLGKIELPGGDIEQRVFRFIKPGMKQKSLEEVDVIKNACVAIDTHPDVVGKNYPKLTSLADNSYTMIKEDLVLKESVNNQVLGRKVYTASDIEVPKVWLSQDPGQLFMYQTLAQGKKISKYTSLVRKAVVTRIVEVWLEEAMFGTGYFHADLHQGNSMVWLRENRKGNDRYLKSFLDFGMFGRLTKNDRINLMGLAIATRINNTKMLSEIAWRLSNKEENKIKRPELEEKLKVRIDALGGANMKVEDMIKFFQEVGLELNENTLSYLRGSITLGDQLTEIDPKNSLFAMSVRVGLKHPVQLLKVLKLEEITLKDLTQLAWKQFISPKLSKSLAESGAIKPNACLGFYSEKKRL